MEQDFRIVVLIKQVPDIEKVRFDVETGRVDRSSAPAETNPFDLNALEACLLYTSPSPRDKRQSRMPSSA